MNEGMNGGEPRGGRARGMKQGRMDGIRKETKKALELQQIK